MATYTNALNKNILDTNFNKTIDKAFANTIARELRHSLESNDITCSLRDIVISPCNILYDFSYEDRCLTKQKIKKIEHCASLGLNVPYVTATFFPLKSGFGINVPIIQRDKLPLGYVLKHKNYLMNKNNTTCCLGINEDNEPVMFDFSKHPHMLISGATGSGKSIGLNVMLTSLLANSMYNSVKILILDPKRNNFLPFKNCSNFLERPVLTRTWDMVNALWDMKDLMYERFDILEEEEVKDINDYNILNASTGKIMPHIFVVIDELPELLQSNKSLEKVLISIAQVGRQAGIHLIVGVQKPTFDQVPKTLVNNLPLKVCFRVDTKQNSNIVLGQSGAELLCDNGDGMYIDSITHTAKHFQGAYVSDTEITQLVDYIQNRAISK